MPRVCPFVAILAGLSVASAAHGQLAADFIGAHRPQPPAAAVSPADIHPAVVRIVAPGADSVSYGSGTLVAVSDKHGLVVTNWHVINEATGPIKVVFPGGFQSTGKVLKIDRDWDLAAISIWKPNVAPVPLAKTAPRPGEPLSIAGYGSGAYRAASGRCTQYVAPGLRFPYEMVELSASARQGDSGGPIFNARGELAGVLFGEGYGRTSGSYCGRVRWFLESLVPAAELDRPPQLAGAAAAPFQTVAAGPEPRRSPLETRDSRHEPASERHSAAPRSHEAGDEPALTHVADAAADSGDNDGAKLSAAGHNPARDVAQTPAGPPGSYDVAPAGGAWSPVVETREAIGWHELAGATPAEQVKTILAGIGGLVVLLYLLRWLDRPVAAPPAPQRKAGR